MPGQLAGDARGSGGGYVYLVAAMVPEGWADVEPVDAVGSPGESFVGGLKADYLDAWRG